MSKDELLAILLAPNPEITSIHDARKADLRYDPEWHHSECDDALLEYIGDPEVTAAFNARVKWYA